MKNLMTTFLLLLAAQSFAQAQDKSSSNIDGVWTEVESACDDPVSDEQVARLSAGGGKSSYYISSLEINQGRYVKRGFKGGACRPGDPKLVERAEFPERSIYCGGPLVTEGIVHTDESTGVAQFHGYTIKEDEDTIEALGVQSPYKQLTYELKAGVLVLRYEDSPKCSTGRYYSYYVPFAGS